MMREGGTAPLPFNMQAAPHAARPVKLLAPHLLLLILLALDLLLLPQPLRFTGGSLRGAAGQCSRSPGSAAASREPAGRSKRSGRTHSPP